MLSKIVSELDPTAYEISSKENENKNNLTTIPTKTRREPKEEENKDGHKKQQGNTYVFHELEL